MKVRILLVIVMVYLLGAFSWWTYSLLSLSKSDFELANNNSLLEARLIENNIFSKISAFESSNSVLIIHKEKTFNVDSSELKNYVEDKYNKDFTAVFDEVEGGFAMSIQPAEFLKTKIFNEYRTRRRAFISEGIFFMLILTAGFIWLLRGVGNIINLNKLQKNFMMAVTHELKTPVASLKLMMQTLAKRTLEEEKRQDIIHKADLNTDRLTKLINELLLAVKIDNNELRPNFQTVDIYDITLGIVNNYESVKPYSDKIKIVKNGELKILGDLISLKTSFANLIENAIKYSFDDFQMTISIDANKKTISFADNGIGISPEEKRKVFRQFYRVGDEEVRRTKGTGLGLFLVKNLLKVHKAKIRIKQNQPKGTVFVIYF